MAVAVPLPLETTPGVWGASDSAEKSVEKYIASRRSGPMTDIMSYSYPPPPSQSGAELDSHASGYMPGYAVQHSASSGIESDSDYSQRELERRDSVSKPMKRTRPAAMQGAPQGVLQHQQQLQSSAQQSAIAEQFSLFNGEKRRNKLGYHRTSVACTHCRRRKIRCIPSTETQGRCVNCIRLKKECTFSAVEQPNTPDMKQKSMPRSSTGGRTSSVSSSPALQTGPPADPYSHTTMPSIQNMVPPAKSPGTENFPPDAKVPSNAPNPRQYDYGQHQGVPNWMPMNPATSPNSPKPADINAGWRSSYASESPMGSSFPAYPPHTPSTTSWTPVSTESTSRDEMGWSYPAPPGRSLSFGGQGTPGHSQQQYPPIMNGGDTGRAYDRKAGSMSTDMYPHQMATGIERVPSAGMEHGVTLPPGAVAPHSYGQWQQSYPYSKPHDPYGAGWYGEGGAHQQHLEHNEQVAHSNEHPPSSQGMYYTEK